MRRHVDFHLAQARASASGAAPGTASSVLESVEWLIRTVSRLYQAKHLVVAASVARGHSVSAERQDLDEMPGHLLDDEWKWATSRVTVMAAADEERVSVLVDDNGPGIPRPMREHVLRRGVRADEVAPGLGLGLAIVADLAELYGGSVSLHTSPTGGTQARLTLPSWSRPRDDAPAWRTPKIRPDCRPSPGRTGDSLPPRTGGAAARPRCRLPATGGRGPPAQPRTHRTGLVPYSRSPSRA